MKKLYVILFSLLSFQLLAKLSDEQVVKIKDLYQESLNLSGQVDDMEQRALVLAHLFYDSKKNLNFAMTVSHLTLGIDRSSRPDRAISFFDTIGMDALATDWRFWGKSLRKINRKMFQRFYFAYKLSEFMLSSGLTYDDIDTTNFTLDFEEFLIDVDPIIDDMTAIHLAKSNNTKISAGTKKTIFENLVYWEHMAIIQPELEDIFNGLHSVLKYTLQNVPSRRWEKYFLEPIFDLRTTYNLSCFKDENTFLKTDNFLDPNNRVEQAMLFYDQVKESIQEMTIIECFKDSYYKHNLPEGFFIETEKFLSDYRLSILRNNSISKIN